uniref:Uncharacterized protein n=1 Tax=Lotharella globosa TaxID=91324 RepID=A0A7S4DUZ7_9EUKA
MNCFWRGSVHALAALASFANAKDPLRSLADKIHDVTATPVESSANGETSAGVETGARVKTLGAYGKCDLRYYGEKGVGPPHTHIFQYDLQLHQDPYAFDAKVSLKNHGDKKATKHVKVKFYASLDKKHVKVKFYASLDQNFGPHDLAHGFLGEASTKHLGLTTRLTAS